MIVLLSLMGAVSWTPANSAPTYANQGLAVRIGLEASGNIGAGVASASVGVRTQAEVDVCDNMETRTGLTGGATIATLNLSGSAEIVTQGNPNDGSYDAFPKIKANVPKYSFGAMGFVGGNFGASL